MDIESELPQSPQDRAAPSPPPEFPEAVQRVHRQLVELGHPGAPRWLDTAARTAAQAAEALGVALGQIAKSVIFRRLQDDCAVLVVTSGDRRVDEQRVVDRVGPIGRAGAEFVKLQTGFSIGGVAPIAHLRPPVMLIDQDLFRFESIWAAAGHPHAVFALSPQDLVRWSGAPVLEVAA